MKRPSPKQGFGASLTPSYETGVFLGINAIPNSLLVMNSPRCAIVRGMKVFLHNDLASTVYSSSGIHRLITTEWMGYEDVLGDEADFTATLESVMDRFQDSWIFTFQNISSMVTGFDLAGLSRMVSRERGRRLITIQGPRLDMDWLDGYDHVVAGLMPHLLADDGEQVELLLMGHLLCRNEADEIGNVRELERLLASLGVEGSRVLLPGAELQAAPVYPDHVAAMPHAGRASRQAATAAGHQPVDLPLPLGIRGTEAWMTRLGEQLGRQEQAKAAVDHELSSLLPELGWLVPEHLLGKSVVVVGDAHLGSALAAFVSELGMQVVAHFNTSRAPAGEADHAVLSDPNPDQFSQLLNTEEVDLVLGSGLFSYLDAVRGVPYVELGFPSYLTHALFPRPYLGFNGVRCMVETIFNSLLGSDERRPRQ